MSWINHVPLACWSTFWKSNFKQQLGCRFDIMDNESYFFVFWHMQLYMSWYIRAFFSFTFLNILYFFKYSCTKIFHRCSLYTFYSNTMHHIIKLAPPPSKMSSFLYVPTGTGMALEWPGGRFKNTYELLNPRALKISMLYKNRIFQCMGKIFCVEFQRYPLKFHSKYLTHTFKDVHFIHRWIFKSS